MMFIHNALQRRKSLSHRLSGQSKFTLCTGKKMRRNNMRNKTNTFALIVATGLVTVSGAVGVAKGELIKITTGSVVVPNAGDPPYVERSIDYNGTVQIDGSNPQGKIVAFEIKNFTGEGWAYVGFLDGGMNPFDKSLTSGYTNEDSQNFYGLVVGENMNYPQLNRGWFGGYDFLGNNDGDVGLYNNVTGEIMWDEGEYLPPSVFKVTGFGNFPEIGRSASAGQMMVTIPEPATLATLTLGAGFIGRKRRRFGFDDKSK